MKFSLQIHQVEVPVPGGELTEATMEQQIETFIERYESIYGKGSAFTGAGVQIGVFRVVGRGRIRTPALPKLEAGPAASPAGTREVYWERARASSRPTSGTAPRSGRAPRSPVRRSSR